MHQLHVIISVNGKPWLRISFCILLRGFYCNTPLASMLPWVSERESHSLCDGCQSREDSLQDNVGIHTASCWILDWISIWMLPLWSRETPTTITNTQRHARTHTHLNILRNTSANYIQRHKWHTQKHVHTYKNKYMFFIARVCVCQFVCLWFLCMFSSTAGGVVTSVLILNPVYP